MDGMMGSAMLRGGANRRFDEYYRCYPVAMMPGPERENVNHGGKVIMPPSALDKLTRLHVTYPMLFELHNGAKEAMTHAGVLEFIAEEGKIYLPYWVGVTPMDLIVMLCHGVLTIVGGILVDAKVTTRAWRPGPDQIDGLAPGPVYQATSPVDCFP